jgi:hypothetical protein
VVGALGIVIVLVGAACSPPTGGDAADVDRAERARAATRALEQAQETDVSCANVVMSEKKRSTSQPEHLVLLEDARATAEPCWDKIEFSFQPTGDDMPPGYEIEYCEPPFTEGDHGQYTVETLGEAFLCVTFTPASSFEPSESGRGAQTYRGNLRLRLDGMHHTEIVRKKIDGLGTVMWLIGLDTRRPFTVDAVNHPPRVILYIAR